MKSIKQLNRESEQCLEIIWKNIDSFEKGLNEYYLDELIAGGYVITQDEVILSVHETEEKAQLAFAKLKKKE